MKIGRLLGVGLAVVFFVPAMVSAQQSATTNFQTFVLEDFDDLAASQWQVNASKFIAEGFPLQASVNTWPSALYRVEPEDRTLNALGVQAGFDRQGYNWVEMVPVEEDDDGELVPRGIPIPGRARNLDVWVWGSNFDYYMDVHVRDFRGMVHVLTLGDLGYGGWRNLRISIPSWIPQESRYLAEIRDGEFASDLRTLELMKLVMWTRPGERVNGFFLYVDEIKVETDMYRDPFDGEELRNPEFVQQLWGTTEGDN